METWLLRLNMGKCKAISYSRRPELNTNYSISGVIVENIENVKDLGVTFDHKLKFDKHINNKINTAYQMLRIVKRNYIYLTPDSFVVFTARCICISAVFAVMQCPSVRLSVTFVDHVKTNKRIFEIFSTSGSDTILVFPSQRGCRHSDGNPPNGGVECKGVW